MKDIRTIIDGVFELASDKEVHLPEKGYLKDVHKAVNSVSESILEKNKTIENNNEMKKNWLIGVTHDIRTPLSIIVGNAEELIQDNVDSDLAARADTIKKQVFKIKYLLDDINLISRLENYLIDVPKAEIDLKKILRESMAEIINSYRTDIFSFEFFDDCDDKIKVHADKHLLKRAFEIILVNSVVHNTNGCHITVQIKQKNEGVLIIFDDDGVGTGETEIEKLNNKTSEHFEHIHGWGNDCN
jgi:signal transduction histidine kinase